MARMTKALAEKRPFLLASIVAALAFYYLRSGPWPEAWFIPLKGAAVGGVTAKALRDWGLVPDLVPSGEQSAAGLLADWPEYDDVLDPINRVFLPRADIATETLVAGLIDLGWEVDDVTAYRTVRATPPPATTRDAIKSGRFDAVVFTSSSTVRNLVGIAGKPHPSTVIAVIGPATAKTAEEHGLRVDVFAPKPDVDVLVDALARDGMAYVPFFPLGGFSPLQSAGLSTVAERLDATPLQVALAWLLRRSPNILLIPGTASLAHLRENLAAAALHLPDDALADLDRVGTATQA